MSDFGTIILFSKESETLSDEDIAFIEESLEEVITAENFSSNITEGNFKKLKQWSENEYCSMITEYYDGEEAEELREFAIEEDIPECQNIIEFLKPLLSDDIVMEARLEDW